MADDQRAVDRRSARLPPRASRTRVSKDDVLGEVTVFHHLLLAHGRAVQEYRRLGRRRPDRPRPNLSPHYPASDDPADLDVDAGLGRLRQPLVPRPVFRGAYPADMRARYEALLGPLDVRPRGRPRHDRRSPPTSSASTTTRRGSCRQCPMTGRGRGECRAGGRAHDRRLHRRGRAHRGGNADRPVRPHRPARSLRDDYGSVPIMITENGAVFSGAAARRAAGRLHPRPPRRAPRRDRPGRSCRRLLPLVVPGQLRVGARLRAALRPRPRRL